MLPSTEGRILAGCPIRTSLRWIKYRVIGCGRLRDKRGSIPPPTFPPEPRETGSAAARRGAAFLIAALRIYPLRHDALTQAHAADQHHAPLVWLLWLTSVRHREKGSMANKDKKQPPKKQASPPKRPQPPPEEDLGGGDICSLQEQPSTDDDKPLD